MDTAPQKSRRSLWKMIALMLAVFLLGNFTGISGSTVFLLRKMQANIRNPVSENRPSHRFIVRTEQKISDDLKLTPDERAAVHEELRITHERLTGLRVRMLGELGSLARDTVDRVSDRLPPDKRRKFRERAEERLRPWGFARRN